MKLNKRIKITGKVQGVFFRQSTLDMARELDIKGWVKNERDGSVLLEIEGHQQTMTAMETWLKRGPEKAKVDNIWVENGIEKGYADFEIL